MKAIWGKIVGSVTGFVMAGPWGALLGAAAGHAADLLQDRGVFDRLMPIERERGPGLTVALVSLAAKLARVDGPVNGDEIAALKRVFHIPRDQIFRAALLFDEAAVAADGFEPHAAYLAETFGDDARLRLDLIEALVVIVLADGPARPAERAMLGTLCALLDLGEHHVERLLTRHAGDSGGNPYAVLGIGRDAPVAAIKAAYRGLIRIHHPDALTGSGAAAEAIAAATARMAAINAAYDRIRAERGWS